MSAPYAGIWQYAGMERSPISRTGGGENGPVQNQYAPLASDNPALQKLIDEGVISRTTRQFSNEGGQGELVRDDVRWDPKYLPTMGPPGVGNKFGNWMPVSLDPDFDPKSGNMAGLINPKMIYNDPNYGWITPSFNDKTNLKNGYDMIGPIFSALLGGGAALAGLGGLSGALAQIPNAARSIGSGGGAGGLLGLLGGMAGGMSGIPMGSMLGRLAGSAAGGAFAPKSSPQMSPAQMLASLSPQQKAMLLMQANSGNLPMKGK